MKAYFGGLRTLAVLSVGVLAAVASAQIENAGDSGFFLRAIDSGGTIDSLADHDNVLSFPVNDITETTTASVGDGTPIIDFNGGPAPINNPWFHPYTEDFVVTAIADVTIPAGQWGIGFTSDDGGQVTLPGVEFVTSFEQNAGDDFFDPNGTIIGGDRLYFPGNRGNRASFGSFVLDEPLETQINVSMWERGGGDNFEVYFIDLEDQYGIDADQLSNFEQDRPNLDNQWDLLGDPDSLSTGWDVRIPESVPAIAIPVTPGQLLNGSATNVTSEEVGDIQPGLLHNWYDVNNPGTIEGVGEFYDLNAGPLLDPDVPAFNPENTWWTGNQAALVGGTTEAPTYPQEIIGQERPNAGGVWGDSDNNNYTVALNGQIRFPRDGEYLFTDGVDDLTVLAIDVNQDGEIDTDPDGGEILINDNAWTNLQRDANDGGFPGEYVPVTIDVPEDGNCDDAENAADECWYDIEALFGEGGGTDAGIIYWNEREDIEFPTENGDGRVIAAEDIPELAIPEANLRSAGGVVITGAELASALNGDFPYEFEINEDGTFDSLEVNRSIDVATTSLDLNGATINLIANGDLSGLSGEFQLLSADSLTGELTVNVPEGLSVDTSRLATEGVLVFGDVDVAVCNPDTGADINGDGSVGFPDFLILSANFGSTDLSGASHELGDLDCTGDVAFADFLALSNAFGTTVGAEASSVPEPSSVTLLGLGALLLGLVRRRRK